MQRSSPAAQRNREPLLAVLRGVLPAEGLVLEVASGTGEHAAFFAEALPMLTWQPSDPAAEARASIAAWQTAAALPNLPPPIDLDAASAAWDVERADAILCVNMVHISPWAATEGLMRGAGRLLPTGAPLVLYGPYLRGGVATAPSNVAFDASLRRRDPAWGLRTVDAVVLAASAHGLELVETVDMPANNLTLVFRRT